MNFLKKIRDVLSEGGAEVYFPGQYEGECKSPYIVVKSMGALSVYGTSSERPMFDIMCIVPEKSYSTLQEFIFETKQKLKRLFPLVSYAGEESESVYLEDSKAYMVSFVYQGARQILNWQ